MNRCFKYIIFFLLLGAGNISYCRSAEPLRFVPQESFQELTVGVGLHAPLKGDDFGSTECYCYVMDYAVLRVIFPQGEEIDTGTGREVVRWDKQWLSGNFMIGFKSNLAGGGFKYSNISFSPAKDVAIVRGRIYGAVKYKNEWRACIIETE